MKVLKWIAVRAKERSTWIGIISILAAAGITMRPEMQDAIVALGAALGGVIAVASGD